MTALELLPAVDVTDGQAVRLVQGVAGSGREYGDPIEAALGWQRAGASWIHLVDLDAAFGRGSNAGLLADVVRRVDVAVEMSGGIRDDESLSRALGPPPPARPRRNDTLSLLAALAISGVVHGAWTSGAPGWPRAAGPPRAGTCTRRWTG